MKIRLKADIPVDPRHGAFKGEVFETIESEPNIPRAVWIKGRTGESVRVFYSEFDIVEDEALTPPPVGCLC